MWKCERYVFLTSIYWTVDFLKVIFFCKDRHSNCPPLQLIKKFTSLDTSKTRLGLEDTTAIEDTLVFLCLLKHMLQVDAGKHITPRELWDTVSIPWNTLWVTLTMWNWPTWLSKTAGCSTYKLKSKSQGKKGKVGGRGQVKSIVTHCWEKTLITSLDVLSSAKENALKTRPQAKGSLDDAKAKWTVQGKKGWPVKAGLHGPMVAGMIKKTSETNMATSPLFVHQEITASSSEGFVDVKTKKKWYRGICRFFRRIFKHATCCAYPGFLWMIWFPP